ncbi:MAG: pantoate--beta-alanine ligase [Candidatus Cloacimonetes bacterium]|nr:pantoate--beta-alanine ligase [Candidatus Cloacimonadota bacterium]MDD4146921.1 pantoate--beta-alanine ligase [Candidatus Cloacimonadota bacterium]
MQLITSLALMSALRHAPEARVGFVPTMGYLHEGHLSLVDASIQNCDITIVSIFVNPTQFGPNEDLASYPRDIDRDLALLKQHGVDYVFLPDAEMMYPQPYHTWVEVSELSGILCGASRHGHFRGVCTIVLKLVNLVKPHYMYMGEKDFQQLTILNVMLKDLNMNTCIVGCPIVREADGLAKSSRNVYLSNDERQIALCLSQALLKSKSAAVAGCRKASELIDIARADIVAAGAKVDYVEIVHAGDLSKVDIIDEYSRMLIAAYVGKTRLIDNMMLL